MKPASRKYPSDCTVVVTGIPRAELEQQLSARSIAFVPPIGQANQGQFLYLNFNVSTLARAAAAQLHNLTSTIYYTPATPVQAFLKSDQAHQSSAQPHSSPASPPGPSFAPQTPSPSYGQPRPTLSPNSAPYQPRQGHRHPVAQRQTPSPNVTSQAQSQALNPNFNLQQDIAAAKKAAQSEQRALRTDITRLQVETPPFKDPKVPSDLIALDPTSREFKRFASLFQEQPVSVKKVAVSARQARFDAWRCTLDQQFKQVTTVLHGTNPVANGNNIARSGPDFSMIGSANGHRFGHGFYAVAKVDHDIARDYADHDGAVCICNALQGNIKSKNLRQSDTAASLFKAGYHSSADMSTHYLVLFHPDSVCVTHVVSFGPDPTLHQQLAVERNKLELEWQVAEKQRKLKLQATEARIGMVDYFCERIQVLPLATIAQLADSSKKFQVEHMQFKTALPVYARKQEFLELLHRSKCVVLKGGTGIGKSVMVPQWMMDDFTPQGRSQQPIAVLVPRRAIAEGLAKHVSEMRDTTVGREVGLGIAGTVFITPESRIVFMTYGFFQAVISSDPSFSKWDGIILDEAHERKIGADELMLKIVAACKARPDFKAVIMSATIAPSVFVDNLRDNQVPGELSVIDIPGVTFPVKNVWYDAARKPWDPKDDSALTELALEAIWVYLQEKGNVLIFVSTTGAVWELVQSIRGMMVHDPQCQVLPLYAALNKAERDEVTNFSKDPKNKGKRLICVSTNVAEAGITIPGISAVLETGFQLEQSYDPATRVTSMKQTRISKASQVQRKGRAGRTQPGTCYTMYTEDCFNSSFEEYSQPEVLKTNLDGFLLGMIATGMDPLAGGDGHKPLDMGEEKLRDSLQRSRKHLLKLKAIQESPTGVTSVSNVGLALSSMPVGIEMGISILKAVSLRCSLDVAIIACVAAAGGDRLFTAKRAAGDSLLHPTGDHLTYLNVFEAWGRHQRSSAWSQKEGLSQRSLEIANEMLQKVKNSMQKYKLSLQAFVGSPQDRQEAVLQSLCSGYFSQTAMPADPSNGKTAFWLLENYDRNPTSVTLNRSSALYRQTNTGMVMFSFQTEHADGSRVVSNISKVQRGWIEDASMGQGLAVDAVTQALGAMACVTVKADVSEHFPPATQNRSFRDAALLALHSNVKDLKVSFPLAVFKTNISASGTPTELVSTCPAPLSRLVEEKLQQAARSIKIGSCDVDMSAVSAVIRHSAIKHLSDLRQQLSKDFGVCIGLVVDPSKRVMTITSLAVVVPGVERRVRECLGLDVPAFGFKANPSPHEKQCVYDLLEAPTAQIFATYGTARGGSMVALVRKILSKTQMWVYGGFVRDAVMRNDMHEEMDIDVGLPKDCSMTPQEGASRIINLAQALGIEFTKTVPAGALISSNFFWTVDKSSEFEVQIVDTVAFEQRQPGVDFDVNNLKMTRTGIHIKREEEDKAAGRDKDQILSNCRGKSLFVLKPVQEVSSRIDKMKARGWTVNF